MSDDESETVEIDRELVDRAETLLITHRGEVPELVEDVDEIARELRSVLRE